LALGFFIAGDQGLRPAGFLDLRRALYPAGTKRIPRIAL